MNCAGEYPTQGQTHLGESEKGGGKQQII